jgi:hypothetical protein
MRAASSYINYFALLFILLGVSFAHLEQEFIKTTAGVIVALPNAFFDSFTV